MNDAYVLRLPRYQDFNQWHSCAVESRAFLEPWEPTWRADEMTEGAFRTRVIRGKQEYASGQAVPLFIVSRQEDQLLGGMTIGYIRRGAAQCCMIGYWMGESMPARAYVRRTSNWLSPTSFRRA
jgi:ribosomal-protein-alanine N-acetyltransferase